MYLFLALLPCLLPCPTTLIKSRTGSTFSEGRVIRVIQKHIHILV